MIVTLAHLRSIPGYGPKPGFCASGSRAFFKRHGLDWDSFRHNGIEAETLAATGDALALALVAWAHKVENA